MDALAELSRRGGIARTATLNAAGVSAHSLRRARERGDVRTIRRGWVALPDADPRVVGAIERGVILGCVTAAEHHGLWVPEVGALHVVAPRHAGRGVVPSRVVVHWSGPVVPRSPDTTVDDLVNSLAVVAQCQPFETALVVWESAMNKGHVDAARLRGLDLPAAARAVLEQARPYADSGLETIFLYRLRWMCLPMIPQVWIIDRPVDLLIGERLVVQIDGGTHVGAQRARDIAHDAQLVLRGYTVLRFGYEQVMERWSEVQAVIMEAVAQGKHRA